jgi:hypothetical protein
MSEMYTAQYCDWSGQWVGDGTTHPTAHEAREHCFSILVEHGYSGVDVRVVEHTIERRSRVLPPEKCAECGGSQVVEVGLPDVYRACPTCVTPPAGGHDA